MKTTKQKSASTDPEKLVYRNKGMTKMEVENRMYEGSKDYTRV